MEILRSDLNKIELMKPYRAVLKRYTKDKSIDRYTDRLSASSLSDHKWAFYVLFEKTIFLVTSKPTVNENKVAHITIILAEQEGLGRIFLKETNDEVAEQSWHTRHSYRQKPPHVVFEEVKE